jgi:hypothetical protein
MCERELLMQRNVKIKCVSSIWSLSASLRRKIVPNPGEYYVFNRLITWFRISKGGILETYSADVGSCGGAKAPVP